MFIGLCSCSANATYVCSQATKKSKSCHKNDMLNTLDCTGSETHSPGYKMFVYFSRLLGWITLIWIWFERSPRVFPVHNLIVKGANDCLKWWLHKWHKGSGSTRVIEVWTCYFKKWCSTLEWTKIVSCFILPTQPYTLYTAIYTLHTPNIHPYTLLKWHFCCRYKKVTSLSPKWNFQQAYLQIFFILEPGIFTIIFRQSRTFIYICWSWLLRWLLIRR